MGALHFVAPKPFDSIIPEELPGSARFYTYASGVAELGTGALLLAPRTSEAGRTGRGRAFHRGVPRKPQHVRLWWDKGWPARLATIARLPLQIPMIRQALKIYRSALGRG